MQSNSSCKKQDVGEFALFESLRLVLTLLSKYLDVDSGWRRSKNCLIADLDVINGNMNTLTGAKIKIKGLTT